MRVNYQEIIEAAGARFGGVRGDSVFFSDPETGARLSLYLGACRSVEDVRLALKAGRDKIVVFSRLEPTEAAAQR